MNDKFTGNKRQTHDEEYVKMFSKGVSIDANKELNAAFDKLTYLKGRNLRINGDTGEYGAAERIDGEVFKEGITDTEINQNNPIIPGDIISVDTYVCVLGTIIKGMRISFWASELWTEESPTAGIIMLNDKIVLLSKDFPIRHNKPIDFDINENCLGGEIYITDYNIPPLYFNIQDMLDNYLSGSYKYFKFFNYNKYIINLNLPINVMVFDSLVNVGVGSGLPPGGHAYSYRLTTEDSESTNWSFYTPIIPVPKRYVQDGVSPHVFKFQDTKGSDPHQDITTPYSIKLKLRIDNRANYNYLELKRTSYINGEGLGFLPTTYIVQRIAIEPNQFSVLEIIDGLSTQTDKIPLSADDSSNTATIIKRAKAIRYFKNKIVLGHVEYEDRTIKDIDIEYKLSPILNKKMNPILRYLGEEGFKNIKNNTYFKSFMNDEKYGLSVICWDEDFSRTFSVPIEEFKNYQFPNKRDAIKDDSLNNKNLDNDFNYGKPHIKTNLIDVNFDLNETFNNVLHTSYTEDPTVTPSELYYNEGLKNSPGKIYNLGNQSDLIANITAHGVPSNPSFNPTTTDDAGYRPRNPVNDNDIKNKRNYGGASTLYDAGIESFAYNANGLNPHYYSLGLSLQGFNKLPEWTKAISIARTKPANRIITQGLAVYHFLNIATSGVDFSSKNLNRDGKSRNTIDCIFTDFEAGLVSPVEIEDFINNPSNYQIQLVEALGFFSEIFNTSPLYYNKDNEDISSGDFTLHIAYERGDSHQIESERIDDKADIVVYAKIQNEDLMRNGLLYPGVNSKTDGIYPLSAPQPSQVAMGVFRNNATSLANPAGPLYSKIYNIENVTINSENEEGKTVYELRLDRPIYATTPMGANGNFSENKEFHEPVYVINIIKNANIEDKSIQEYVAPTNFIKLESLVGISNGANIQTYDIVDERLEDFFTFPTLKSVYNLHSFVYVDKNDNTDRKRYINITHLSPADILVIENDIANQTTVFCGKLLYGTYTATKTQITFNDVSSVHQPLAEELIYIQYDNEKPISVFGGDTVSGDVIFPQIHRKSEDGYSRKPYNYPYAYDSPEHSDGQVPGTQVRLENSGFPYNEWKFPITLYKHLYYLGGGSVQEERKYRIHYIRQLVWIFTSQSRFNLAFCYGNFYPNISYVERPNCWNNNSNVVDNYVWQDYEKDYVNEFEKWVLGGIRVDQFPSNLDYSKNPEHDKFFFRKTFLLNTQNKFCTRLAWSNTRLIQNYGSPNLRTFRPFNYKDISDKYGDIVKLFDATTQFGDNLYAICERNIANVLVRKNTLSSASGEVLATTSTDDSEFITQEIWLATQDTKALEEGFKFSFAENGDEAFFCNREGVFIFKQNKVTPIHQGFKSVIFYQFLQALINSVEIRIGNTIYTVEYENNVTGYYDTQFDEYGVYFKTGKANITELSVPYSDYTSNPLQEKHIRLSDFDNKLLYVQSPIIDNLIIINPDIEGIIYFENKGKGDLYIADYSQGLIASIGVGEYLKLEYTGGNYFPSVINKQDIDIVDNLFIYCNQENIKAWLGTFDYKFDRITSDDGKKFGFRGLQSFELENGNIINGELIKYELTDAINPDKQFINQEKMLTRIQVNANVKPDSIDFLQNITYGVQCTMIANQMKHYGGWGNMPPRIQGSGNRIRGTYFTYRINYQGTEKISVSNTSINYKVLN